MSKVGFIIAYLVILIATVYQMYILKGLGVKSPLLFIISELVIITGLVMFHMMGEQHEDR